MQRIFLFLLKYNGVFAFIILQVIALSFYFTRNITDNKRVFVSSANGIIGSAYDYSSRISRYWNLAAVNDSLARENAALKMQLPSSKFSSLVDLKEVKDTTLKQQYRYLEAKVVNNTIHRPHNYITINRGRNQGVKNSAAVINAESNGIVGIVHKVGKNYSVVMSLLNIDIRVSAKIKRNNYFGSLLWDGKNSSKAQLQSLPKHADIVVGDTIITSGYSTVFPEGIMIGVVDTFAIPSGINFYDVKVNLVNDMNAIRYVYVVNDLLKEEKIALEEEVNNE
jgi:rod shape-determining protein MreC